MTADNLIVAGKHYRSRLLVGTGKYKDFTETRAAIDASASAGLVIVLVPTIVRGLNSNHLWQIVEFVSN